MVGIMNNVALIGDLPTQKNYGKKNEPSALSR